MGKVSGKKSPIQFEQSILKLNGIYKYGNFQNKKLSNGFEFIFLDTKIQNKKRDPPMSKDFILFGKIIARNSSDLQVIIANKLLLSVKYAEFMKQQKPMLVQYPIESKDPIKRLILLVKIDDSSDYSIVENLESILYNFSEDYRNILKSIAEDYVNKYK